MGSKLVYSSESYLLNIEDVLRLEKHENYIEDDDVVIFLGSSVKGIPDLLLSGENKIFQAKKKNLNYVEVKIAYYSFSSLIGFFVNLIKPIKRKYYVVGNGVYRTLLEDLNAKNLTRGHRDSSNAYAWTGKYAMPENVRKTRYEKLYNSLKEKGYDYNHPMLILLNRFMGVKDQFLQGHHRMTLCNELGIKEVSIKFWSSPKSPNFMKKISQVILRLKGKQQ